MVRATTRQSTWHRSIERWPVVSRPPTSFWPNGRASGTAPSCRCSATSPTKLSSGMKRRLVVLSPLAVPIAAARAQSADWQTVVAPDLSFRIEMPTPVAKSTADEKEKGHANPRVAWESKRDEQIFDFDYVDYDNCWFSNRNSKVMAKELVRF